MNSKMEVWRCQRVELIYYVLFISVTSKRPRFLTCRSGFKIEALIVMAYKKIWPSASTSNLRMYLYMKSQTYEQFM